MAVYNRKFFNLTGSALAANLVIGEIPSGNTDGSNVTFTLANSVYNNTSIDLYLGSTGGFALMQNGVGKDYTVSGATITMAVAPPAGSVILVDYILP